MNNKTNNNISDNMSKKQTNKNISFLMIALKALFFAVFIAIFYIAIKSYTTDSSLEFLYRQGEITSNVWRFLLDYTSNSFYSWRFYSKLFKFTLFISNVFSINFNTCFYYINLSLFFIFLIPLIKLLNKNLNLATSSFLSLNFVVMIMLFFGNKTFLISSITFLPLFIFSLLSLYKYKDEKHVILNTLLFILSTILLVRSAYGLSFFYIIFSCLILLCLTSTNTATNDTTNTNTTTNNNTYLRIANFLLILSFCYALYYITFSVPYLPSFNFPWYATVVKDDGLLGVLRPLLIESSQIPFVDEMKEKKLYAPFLLFLSLYILFVIARYLKSNVSENKYLSYLLIFFLLSFLIECFLPINISIIMPFKAIWRTVPSIYTFSLYPIFLFFILFTFFIFTILNLKNFIFIYLLNIILSVLVSFNNFKPLLISDTATNFMSNVIKGDLLNSEFKNIILSPSSSTIKALGFQYLTKKDIVFNKRMQRNIKILNPTLSSNYGENTLKQILDRNPKSRYSTLKTRQDGDEWIKISLPKSYSIHGVILDTGDYRTDFPTSILITTCDDKKIAEQVNLGQIEYTSLGYPYYGGQSNMKIVFEDIVKTDCIKIYQTGKNKHYEWSIAKIKFILPDMERKKNKKDKEKNKKEK